MMEQTPLSPIFWNKVLGGGTPGPTPSGTISITENGTYDVAAFAEAEVAVEEPQGLVDMVIDYADSSEHTVSAVISKNEVSGYTLSTGNMDLFIPIRHLFVLNTGDEVALTLSNVDNRGLFWDIALMVATSWNAIPRINVITNLRITNGTTRITYSGNPIPVIGLLVNERSNAMTDGRLKISLAVNGETLF